MHYIAVIIKWGEMTSWAVFPEPSFPAPRQRIYLSWYCYQEEALRQECGQFQAHQALPTLGGGAGTGDRCTLLGEDSRACHSHKGKLMSPEGRGHKKHRRPSCWGGPGTAPVLEWHCKHTHTLARTCMNTHAHLCAYTHLHTHLDAS